MKLTLMAVIALLLFSADLFSIQKPPPISKPKKSYKYQRGGNYPQKQKYRPYIPYKPKKKPIKKKFYGIRIIMEAGGNFNSEPTSGKAFGYGRGYGYGGAFGIEFVEGDENYVQIRFEINLNRWKGGGDTFKRTPYLFDIRIFPVQRYKYVKPFIDLGLEISGDQKFAGDASVHAGFTPGAGIQFEFLPFYIGAVARYHLIRHPYVTLKPFIGFKF